ncbi:hypothetical protein DPMN_118729 [Dreissena polymorpha]|uniref:Uncharacterized protein n=1 Tax=Dreissena polymorpha TaxID=45954 RepID=A0A9D4GKP3_DREPO|nr:hypothetical protein DPMN_118729 [Dreissena polymorpha]
MLVVAVTYIWLDLLIPIDREKCKSKLFEANDQVIRISHEKRKTKNLSKIMNLVVVLIYMAREKCKTKYLFDIKMLVVLVFYLWLDQLICIAREKRKTE